MSNDAKNCVGWLQAEIQGIESYHNHKETMAWTATALLLAGGAAFVSAVPQIAIEHQLAASIIVICGSFAIACFLRMQFERRWSAADASEGLRTALTKLHNPSSNPATLNWEVATDGALPGLPKFVANEIAEVKKHSCRLCWKAYRDPRRRSEVVSYLLVILTSISMIMAILNPPIVEDNQIEAVATRVSELTAAVSATSSDLRTQVADVEARLQARIDELRKSHNTPSQPMRNNATRR